MDVTRGGVVEAELDRLIGERHDRRVREQGDRLALEAWMESERRYDQERQRENRAAWFGWHLEQAERHRRTLEDLMAHYEARAAKPREPAEERGGRGEGTR